MLHRYTILWLFILGTFTYEYWALHELPEYSIIKILQENEIVPADFNTSTEAGRPISLYLGWGGISIMLLTNLYILRKRISFMQNWGSLPGWLDFHIFCGLVGPTFILFHCDFKVRGLVAISFWSMMVSFSSGVIGRYLYIQLVKQKSDWDKLSDKWWKKFSDITKKENPGLSDKAMDVFQQQTLIFTGIPKGYFEGITYGPFTIFASTFLSDIKMLFALPPTLKGLKPETRYLVKEFAVTKRKSLTLESYQKLMGYWHTFHLPFAFFMYGAAIIHIIAALLFGVTK